MTGLYFWPAEERQTRLLKELERYTGHPCTVLRGKYGKPYAKEGGVFFNLSTSGGLCVAAIGDTPIGVDTQLISGGDFKKKYSQVLNTFCAEELEEIENERDFMAHWTAREAYAKLRGDGIWRYVRRLKFVRGTLFSDGEPTEEQPVFCHECGAVTALCATDTRFKIKEIIQSNTDAF